MSQENVELVRRMVERWNAGDVEGWVECWSSDAEWTSQPIGAFEGGPRTYRGHDGLRRFVADVLEGFADLGEFVEPSFRDVGGSVLVLADYRARAGTTGPEASASWGWLFEPRDGEVVRGRDFLDQREAIEAAGLESGTPEDYSRPVARERDVIDPTGELSGQISTRFVQILKEYSGKGPSRCRTYLEDDIVVILLRGGFTLAEDTLFEAGKWLDVRASRHAFQDTMEGHFTGELERMTGRRVHAFMSASHQDPDLQVEIFVLEPSPDPPEDLPHFE